MLVLVVVVVATTDTLIVDCQCTDRAEQGVCQRCERKRTYEEVRVQQPEIPFHVRDLSIPSSDDEDGEGEC